MIGFFLDDPVFSVLLCLFIIEQIFYYLMGSYPYRYSFVIKKMALPSALEFIKTTEPQNSRSLAMKVNEFRSEVYLHERYPLGIIGPLFFVGQITLDKGGTAYIRLGPLTGIFLMFLIYESYKDIFSGVLILIFIIWLYIRFYRNYQDIVARCS